jgi:hypothetical protein
MYYMYSQYHRSNSYYHRSSCLLVADLQLTNFAETRFWHYQVDIYPINRFLPLAQQSASLTCYYRSTCTRDGSTFESSTSSAFTAQVLNNSNMGIPSTLAWSGNEIMDKMRKFQFPLSTFQFPISSVPFPLSNFQFPMSTFHFPLSTLHFPDSRFHIPHYTFHFPYCTFHFPYCTFNFSRSKYVRVTSKEWHEFNTVYRKIWYEYR